MKEVKLHTWQVMETPLSNMYVDNKTKDRFVPVQEEKYLKYYQWTKYFINHVMQCNNYLIPLNFSAPVIFAPVIFAPLIFVHHEYYM